MTPTQSAAIKTAEDRAILDLKALAKRWPNSLWLFSGSGSLYVMRMGADGKPVMTRQGGVDQSCIVTRIDGIYNDGGDWD